jgi:hypothetical protein
MNQYVKLFAIAALCLSAAAQEKDNIVKELTEAVKKTVDRETHNGEILKMSMEGKKYEINFVRMGTTHRIALDQAGVVTEYKDEILLDMLPARAKEAIEADAKGYELLSVSRYVRGKDVIYRSAVMKDGKRQGIQVAPDGTLINEREGGARAQTKK